MYSFMWYMSAMLFYNSYFAPSFALPVSDSHEFIPYKLINKTENWEKRIYNFNNGYFIGIAKDKVDDFEAERKDANKKLIDYIHGKNKEHANIPIALPTFEILKPGGFVSIFYKTIPQPLDEDIDIQAGLSPGKLVCYVKTLHGGPTISEIKSEALLLVKTLEKDGISLDRDTIVIARYSENVDVKIVEILMREKADGLSMFQKEYL